MSDSEKNNEEGKRKRYDAESNVFEKSKKVFRNPKPYEKTEDDGELKEMMLELLADNKRKAKETEEMKALMESMVNEIKGMREENKEDRKQIKALTKENERINKEMIDMKQQIKNMEITLERVQKQEKKNNLIVKGLTIENEDEEEVKTYIGNFIQNELDIEVDITNTTMISNKIHVIKVKSFKQKMEILKNKNKLKRKKGDKVYLECDYTSKELENQKQMRIYGDIEKKKGRNVKLGYNFVVIDGKRIKWNDRMGKTEEEVEEREKVKN